MNNNLLDKFMQDTWGQFGDFRIPFYNGEKPFHIGAFAFLYLDFIPKGNRYILKLIDTYRKLKPVYDRYKASKDKEKFLRGFESEIILFEAAAREIKKAGLTKLPSSDKVKAELEGLSARKAALQTELRKIQREEKEYDTLRQNVDALLERPKEQEQQRQRSNDLK